MVPEYSKHQFSSKSSRKVRKNIHIYKYHSKKKRGVITTQVPKITSYISRSLYQGCVVSLLVPFERIYGHHKPSKRSRYWWDKVYKQKIAQSLWVYTNLWHNSTTRKSDKALGAIRSQRLNRIGKKDRQTNFDNKRNKHINKTLITQENSIPKYKKKCWKPISV